jgi:hypothetical protein
MKDDTGAALQHAREQTPIEPHRRQQIDVQCLLPVVIRQCGESLRWEPPIH